MGLKRNWVPRSIKLPETTGEWMQAEYLADAVQELYSQFDTAIMVKAVKGKSLYITEANVLMIFMRYLPKEEKPLPTPF